jgi:hypothetical protein
MRTLLPTFLLLSVPVGCGMDVETSEQNIEHQIQWVQAPGEIQDCHVFKLDNMRAVEVDRLQIKFPEGSHHVHIYRSNEAEADKVYDCFKGIDWTRWSLLVGAQTQPMDWQLPEGVTLPLEPHQQILAQVHWLNTTDKTVETTIDLSFHTTEVSQEHLGTVFGVNKRIDIAPGQRTRVEQFCPVPEGAKLHAVMGHFHMHGYDYRMLERTPNQTDGQVLYSAPDEPAFEFKTFLPAHEVPSGAGFQFGCSYFNYGTAQLTWGSDTQTQEHCNMTAYYSPAESVSDLCVLEPSKLTALTPSRPEVLAGEDFTFDVALAEPEASDVTVALSASDPSAFDMPESVGLAKGQLHAAFTVHARRMGNFEIIATLNGARIVTGMRVGGLVISEVFYQPSSGGMDNLQWIELKNRTNVSLDLSTYSIGAGTTDYMLTRLQLPMTVPAHGCIVVGGPASAPANYFPTFALNADLDPNLGLGLTEAAGIGLFTSAGMSATSRPIDAVVYGGMNTTLRGPDGQLAPVWPGAVPGGSIKRVTSSVWAKSATPSPGTCDI